jgi:Mn-dependent DtxR family transcriptional regulator
MTEATLLLAVARYPHPVALARRLCAGGTHVPAVRRLEAQGLVVRRRGLYRLTRQGRRELELAAALARVTSRAVSA